MNRVNIKKLKIQQSNERWSKEQDIYLIENKYLWARLTVEFNIPFCCRPQPQSKYKKKGR